MVSKVLPAVIMTIAPGSPHRGVLGPHMSPEIGSSDTIALAADHGGFELKQLLADYLREKGIEILDLGTNSLDSVDYPDMVVPLVDAIRAGRARFGLLMCGTGIGISIAANRNADIRAALCHDVTTARLARQHNDANVLVLGGRITGFEVAKDCLDVFLTTTFEGGRHARRVAKLGIRDTAC
jgi:ribose 5-phosphate isomerase B